MRMHNFHFLLICDVARTAIQASVRMPVLHDKFAQECSTVWATSGVSHANSAKGHSLDLVFCMTNEEEGELCNFIGWCAQRLRVAVLELGQESGDGGV